MRLLLVSPLPPLSLLPQIDLEEEDLGAFIATDPSPDGGKSLCLLKTMDCDDDVEKTSPSLTILMVSKKGKSPIETIDNKT